MLVHNCRFEFSCFSIFIAPLFIKPEIMKKYLLLLSVIICLNTLNAQDVSKVFSSPTVVWLGIDFTRAKFIGLSEDSPHTIKDEYFKAWNDLTIDMDLAKMFQKTAAYKDPNGVSKLNHDRETETMKANDEAEMSAETIGDIVNVIPTGQKKTGLGLVFVVQSFNKTAATATVHVTFFDIASRKVLLSKKVVGKPGSGNTKSAWVAALKDIFSQIDKKEFKNWRKEANY